MNSESFGKLEGYLAQYVSATSGRQEQTQGSNVTVPVQAASTMESTQTASIQSSDWSPTCKSIVFFIVVKS